MNQHHSRVALLAFGTAVPAYQFQQQTIGHWMADSLRASPALNRWIRRLYELSGIETRYSCLPDPTNPPAESRFGPGNALADTPTTAERMAIYRRDATQIGVTAAQRALADYDSAHVAEVAAQITHLFVVSCTGFFAPGLDQLIANQLGLRPNVERTLVGFMGCAAAFNALRLAHQIVCSQPNALVMVVCVELCSLHIQAGDDRINLVVASLFSDGAAACLVGSPPRSGRDYVMLERLYSELAPETADEMVWQIGDHGFTLHLSPDIPRKLGMVAPAALATLLAGRPMPPLWAIHPGGRAIVDRIADLFHLSTNQIAPSLDILRRFGNMSSPTILFVLNELRTRLRQSDVDTPLDGVAMAFGPGLVVEMAYLTYVPLENMQTMAVMAEAPTAVSYVA